MKAANLRFLGAFLVVAFSLSAANSWARLPKPIQVRGIVLFVDHDTKSLVFKSAKDKKPFVLDWDKETEFIKGGTATAPTTLTKNSPVVIHYKDLSFRNPLLKKVIWTGSTVHE